jgi:sugar O-acyltransferase (sialic acid O-acetyltransferase NeuD family)
MTSKKRRVLLVGAGDFARELASWMHFNATGSPGRDFGGFLDDDPNALANYPEYAPGVIGGIADYQPDKDDDLVMAIANPAAKLRVAGELEARGATFLTFVHPSVLVAKHVKIGRGVVICPNAVVSCHATLGDFVAINLGSTIGHDATIGRGCTLSAHTDVTGFGELGEGVFLGSHAVVLPRAKVGAFSKVGAGSVVLRGVQAGATVMGVPAKQILPGV